MLKIAICDDNPVELQKTKEYILTYASQKNISLHIDSYSNGYDLIEMQKTNPYPLLLLDIVMPGITGIELARKIRSFDTRSIFIYLTTSDEYTKEAYSVNAIGYIMKPLNINSISNTLDRCLRFIGANELKTILVPTKDGTITVNLDTLMYVEHIKHVLFFHLDNGSVISSINSSMSLSELASELFEYSNFIQPHRAYLINMDFITTMTKTDFVLRNNHLIPIPIRRYSQLRKQYFNYVLA